MPFNNEAYNNYAKADYASGKLNKAEIDTLKDYDPLYKTAIALTTATLAGKTAVSRLPNFACCPFSALYSNFNPQLIINKPAVKIFASLKNKQHALLSKRLKMANTIKAAGESTVAAGFNIDIRADLDLLISESQRLQTIAKPSSLTAGQNIKITTGENAQITGAQITAGDNIAITAQNTNIIAAQNTTTENSDQKQTHIIPLNNKEFCSFSRHTKILTAGIHKVFRGLKFEHNAENGQNKKLYKGISYGWGTFGGPDTGGIDASIAQNTINRTTYKNARLDASDITINTAENTEIAGANLNAGTITINTGNDLTVQSLQDKYFEYGFSLGGGLSFEQGKEYGATANYGQTNGNGKWVNRQTSLYGADALTITTQNNTNFIGATANTPTGNLQINTGTLSYSDLSDRNYKQEIGLQASLTKNTTNTGDSQTDKEFEANLGISDQLQNTQTAIGAGQITIRDNSNQDISNLNRNPETAQTQTSAINLDISIETDTLKAFDPDSYQALKELPQNIVKLKERLKAAYNTLQGHLRNQELVNEIQEKYQQASKKYQPNLTLQQQIILKQMKQEARNQGYDVDKMTMSEKLQLFDKLAQQQSLSEKEKIIRDIAWYTMGNQPKWTELRKDQQEDIISELVKNENFWYGESNWNKAIYGEKEQEKFLKEVSNLIADTIDMRRVEFGLYEDELDTDGQYVINKNRTEINKLSNNYSDFYTVINTVTHETGRHGYQDYVIETKEDFLKNYPYLENQVKIFEYSYDDDKMWPGDGISYDNLYQVDNIDYIIYRNDPKEADAFNMGDTVEKGVKDINEEYKKMTEVYIIQTKQAIERIKEYEAQNK